MGNIAAIDMGIVILRCSIFDRNNFLFPSQIRRQILKEDPKHDNDFYFMHELSFYSVEHGGTFHFFQFNVLYANRFQDSLEFQHICEFLRKVFKDEKTVDLSNESILTFLNQLGHRKSIIDLRE